MASTKVVYYCSDHRQKPEHRTHNICGSFSTAKEYAKANGIAVFKVSAIGRNTGEAAARAYAIALRAKGDLINLVYTGGGSWQTLCVWCSDGTDPACVKVV